MPKLELLIFRHAKSSWSSGIDDDFIRPLNKRGVRAARLMGQTLRKMDYLPEAIYLSSSVRTTQTCELFVEAAQLTGIPYYPCKSLYHADLGTLLSTISRVAGSCQRVMLIGHNPGLENLLLHLCPDAPALPDGKLLTTANIALVGLEGEFPGGYGEADLLTLLRPKEL